MERLAHEAQLGDAILMGCQRSGNNRFRDDIRYLIGVRVTEDLEGWKAGHIAECFHTSWRVGHSHIIADGAWKTCPEPFIVYRWDDEGHDWVVDNLEPIVKRGVPKIMTLEPPYHPVHNNGNPAYVTYHVG